MSDWLRGLWESWTTEKTRKMAWSFLIGLAGVVVSYAIAWLPTVDWTYYGPVAPVVVAAVSVALNAVRKALQPAGPGDDDEPRPPANAMRAA